MQLAIDLGAYGNIVVGKCASSRLPENAIACEKTGAYNTSLSTTSIYVAEDGVDEMYDNENALQSLSYSRFQYYADDFTVEGQGEPRTLPYLPWLPVAFIFRHEPPLADTAQTRSRTSPSRCPSSPRPMCTDFWG